MVNLADTIQVLFPNAISLVDFRIADNGSGPFVAYWNTSLLGPQPSQATIDAVTQAQVDAARTMKEHEALTNLVATRDRPTRLLVALLAIILAEFNLHAIKINAILDAVDGAATLANLKTAVAAIVDYPQRTKAQLLTALNNAINAGEGD